MNNMNKKGNTPIIKMKWSIVMSKSFGRILFIALIAAGFISYKVMDVNGLLNSCMNAGQLSGQQILKGNASELQPEIAEKILRFHVLANSDSDEDQQVKIKVRDAVGKYIEPKLIDSKSLEETKEIVESEMDNIIKVADDTLFENGFSYKSSASVTVTDFPEKSYGEYTFPAGKYQALQIVLGDGNGHNWWCVLYPNMCFRGSVYEVVSEEAEESLREVLTQEEYEAVFDSGNFQIDFKLLEILQ